MNIKLSICIPTFNRSELLSELLNSIFLQPESKFIEVCISDNASEDNTYEMVLGYQEKFNNIVFSSNESNIGPDRNYLRAASMASGDYVWLMGSDDAIAPNGIEKILKYIKTGRDIYLQDRLYCDKNLNPLVRQNWWVKNTKQDWDFSIDSPDSYILSCRSLGGIFSYLSSIVVKKKSWDLFKNVPDLYCSSAYSHVYPLLSIIFNNGSLQLINNSGVKCRGGNDFFAKDGMKKRVLIDIDGYSLFAKEFSADVLFVPLVYERNYRTLSFLFYDEAFPSRVFWRLKSCGFSGFEIVKSYFYYFIRLALRKL